MKALNSNHNIEIVYDDNDLLVVNKPAGVLVHPTEAGEENTLASFIEEKCPGINQMSWPDKARIGVVHRLDKDTSGLIVMAKSPEILAKLQEQFKNRNVQKVYTALVFGKVDNIDGEISAAITRGDAGLQKVQEMTYSFSKSTVRPAVTNYHVDRYYKYAQSVLTLVEAMPKTGRMHQIRVHLKYLGFPIIGDPLYNNKESRKLSSELDLHRQFLHSTKLEFIHPVTSKIMKFESAIAPELENVISKLSHKEAL